MWTKSVSVWILEKTSPQPETITSRFIRLFDSHGVHRNQIPRFFGHNLTLQDVQDDDSLFKKLDEPLLHDVCALFGVRREWLDAINPIGTNDQIHEVQDFCNDPEKFESIIAKLKASIPNIEGVLIAPANFRLGADAVMIFQEKIGQVDEKEIYRFHLHIIESFFYWKSRAVLSAYVATAYRHQVILRGKFLPKNKIDQIKTGNFLLALNGRGIWKSSRFTWYPEDMAQHPDAFLKGVDPEDNNYGIIQGLKLWIELSRQGRMNTGLNVDSITEFQQRLAEYEPRQKSEG